MNSRTVTLWISMFLVFVASLGIGLFLYYRPKNDGPAPVSVINMGAIPSVTQTQGPEPEVTSWKDYNNDTYQFVMSVPDGWNMQDFSASYPKGGTLIAFSPETLPCETCSYLHNGYFSLKIYSKESDREAYDKFQSLLKSPGQGAQGVSIDGKTGVFSQNVISVENSDQGWVYEFYLDKDNGNAKALDSKIYQRMVSSFRFTGLRFK